MGGTPQEDMHTHEISRVIEADMREIQDDDMEQDMAVKTQEDMMMRTDRNVSKLTLLICTHQNQVVALMEAVSRVRAKVIILVYLL